MSVHRLSCLKKYKIINEPVFKIYRRTPTELLLYLYRSFLFPTWPEHCSRKKSNELVKEK